MKIKINVPGVSPIRPHMEVNTTARMYVNNYITTLLSRGISTQLCACIMCAMDINIIKETIDNWNDGTYIQVLLETIMLEIQLSNYQLDSKEELIIKTTLQELF